MGESKSLALTYCVRLDKRHSIHLIRLVYVKSAYFQQYKLMWKGVKRFLKIQKNGVFYGMLRKINHKWKRKVFTNDKSVSHEKYFLKPCCWLSNNLMSLRKVIKPECITCSRSSKGMIASVMGPQLKGFEISPCFATGTTLPAFQSLGSTERSKHHGKKLRQYKRRERFMSFKIELRSNPISSGEGYF